MLQTCSKIDIPPKPRRNDAIIILIDNFFIRILQILFKPLVTSKIPSIMALLKLAGIFSKLNKGLIKVKFKKTSKKATIVTRVYGVKISIKL